MAFAPEPPSSMDQDDSQELISRIYDVALDPSRYEELAESWQRALDRIADRQLPQLQEQLFGFRQHLQRADVILALAEQSALAPGRLLQQRLDAESQAMLAVDGTGLIQAVNEAARLRYQVDAGARLSDLPLDADAVARLRTESAATVRRGPSGSAVGPALLRIGRNHGDESIFVAITPWQTPEGTWLALLKTTDFAWPETLTPLLAEAFGLTAAEADVVKLVVEGRSVQEVAEARHRSVATIRSQIRAVYDKTGTHSQAEFIRMAVGLTLLQMLGDARPEGAHAPADTTADRLYGRDGPNRGAAVAWRLLPLAEGRQLEYAEFGAPDGLPCLYLHSEFLGGAWPPQLIDAAVREGVRVIAPARARYGRSSGYPRGAINHQQVSADLCALLDRLGLDDCVLLGHTIGGRFGVTLAAAQPGRCRSLVWAAPALPHGAPEDEANMPLLHRFSSSIVQRHPDMLEFFIRAGYAYIRRIGTQAFLEKAFGHAPADLAVIRNPAWLAVLEEGIEYAARQGYQSVLVDYRAPLQAMREMLLTLSVPVYAVIGSDDRNTRLQRAERLINSGAPLSVVPAPGGAQLLTFTHPELLIATVRQAWQDRSQ